MWAGNRNIFNAELEPTFLVNILTKFQGEKTLVCNAAYIYWCTYLHPSYGKEYDQIWANLNEAYQNYVFNCIEISSIIWGIV